MGIVVTWGGLLNGVFNLWFVCLFRYRLIDGTKVINELKMDDSGAGGGGGASRLTAGASSSQEDSPRTGPETPPVGHIDGITDLVLCKNQRQMFIASSSRDGVIKLWKWRKVRDDSYLLILITYLELRSFYSTLMIYILIIFLRILCILKGSSIQFKMLS